MRISLIGFLAVLALPILAQDAANFCANGLDATLWTQTSTEWQMNCRQAFRTAELRLVEALTHKDWSAALEQKADFSGKPPAIILDIDETVLDNSPYQAQLIIGQQSFKPETWDAWIALRQAEAIPGAVDFIKFARTKNVKVFYVTNRECGSRQGGNEACPQKADTLANLRAMGFPDVSEDTLLLKGEHAEWGSEKESRRSFVAENYRILLLIGDDLGDFMSHVKDAGVTAEQRLERASISIEYWGVRWISLPNPTYGSWQRVLGKDPKQKLRQPMNEQP